MSNVANSHRPLLGGVRIDAVGGGNTGGWGTLTGLAVRNRDNKKILITNLHVMAGLTNQRRLRNPTGAERMYQGGRSRQDLVGGSLVRVDFDLSSSAMNRVDIAGVTLGSTSAKFMLHDEGHSSGAGPHEDRVVIRGTIDPQRNERYLVLGAESGEQMATVITESTSLLHGGANFVGVTEIQFPADIERGDSGSPIVKEVRPGVYKMVGALFSRDGSNHRIGYAYRASTAQSEMKIKFGHREPVANAGDDQGVLPNTVVTLDGSASKVYDGDAKYQWKQDFGPLVNRLDPLPPTVAITNPTNKQATFTMPTLPEGISNLRFKLTVTDSYGLKHSDLVSIFPNRKPVANAGPDQQVARGVRVHLKGSAQDPDTGQKVDYEWTKITGPDVTLHNSDTLTPYFDAPNESAIFAWRLTVKDSLRAEFSHWG